MIGSSKLLVYFSNQPTYPWNCTICQTVNDSLEPKCTLCGLAAPSTNPLPIEALVWTCPCCGIKNHRSANRCEECNEAKPSLIKSEPGSANQFVIPLYVQFSFAKGYAEFVAALQGTIRVRTIVQPLTNLAAQSASHQGGISGIMRSMEAAQQVSQATLSEAFTDIDKLMAKASELVKLSTLISAKIVQKEGDAEYEQFQQIVASLGIQSPSIRRGQMGYEAELGRQLADIAQRLLDVKRTKMLPLVDLYCYYNKARGGIDLISPADFSTTARNEWPRIPNCPVQCTMIGSVMVVQSADLTEESILKTMRDCVMTGRPLNSLRWAEIAKVPLVIAKEQLVLGERVGVVVKDVTLASTEYYANLILLSM